MCFKITPALREYFRYQGISADLERRGFGSSRPQLARAIRQKQQETEKAAGDQCKRVNSSNSDLDTSDQCAFPVLRRQ
jgi:hypothetical protein